MASDPNSNPSGVAAQAPGMPLFYSNPVPVNRASHAKAALKRNIGYGFTRQVNAVPVNIAELARACHGYPIVFSSDETAFPVAILGLRDNENLFVDANDQWVEGLYVPAYVRRYPFILSTSQGTDNLLLCINDPDNTLEPEGEQRFFDDAGEPTPLARNVMEFCQAYNSAGEETTEFAKALQQAGVLTRHEVEIGLPGDRKFQFGGFQIVDPQKLAALDDAIFLEWRRKGWLAFIYAHLLSEPNWQRLAGLLHARMAES